MTAQTHPDQPGRRIWHWPVDVTVYDRSPHLTADEMDALAFAMEYRRTAKR